MKAIGKDLRSLLPIIGLFIILVMMVASLAKHRSLVCTEVEIKLSPDEGTYFLAPSHVLQIAAGVFSVNDIIGHDIASLDLYDMTMQLQHSPFIENASVFLGYNGKLTLNVKQRIPLFRVVTSTGQTYYVEKSGIKIPYRKGYAIRVPVVSGNISESFDDTAFVSSNELYDMLQIFNKISESSFWTAQIEQAYVDKKKGYILIPKVGSHTIVLGNSDRLNEKLDNLQLFYNQAFSNLGWDAYSEIDLSFEGQVVAQRKNSIE
jgi:cell division protein FtsQ